MAVHLSSAQFDTDAPDVRLGWAEFDSGQADIRLGWVEFDTSTTTYIPDAVHVIGGWHPPVRPHRRDRDDELLLCFSGHL